MSNLSMQDEWMAQVGVEAQGKLVVSVVMDVRLQFDVNVTYKRCSEY